MTGPESWCTDWQRYDLPRLWAMVSMEDTTDAWAQVSGWRRMRDAVHAQRERLAACRRALVQTWPPEHSAASTAFVAVLEGLVASMTQAAQAADSTAKGLAGILQALATAKAEIRPLYDEWVARSDDLVPEWWDHAEEELIEKARTAMRKAEEAVAGYTPMIQPPPQYEIFAEIDRADVLNLDRPSEQNFPSTPSPFSIPPIAHLPPPPVRGTESAASGGPVLAGGPVHVPVPAIPPGLPPALIPSSGAPGSGGANGLPPVAWLVPTPRGPVIAPGGVIGRTVPPGRAAPGAPAPPATGAPRGAVPAPGTTRGPVPGLVAPGAIPPANPGRPAGTTPSGGRSRPLTPAAGGTGFRTPDGHTVTISGLASRPADPPWRPPADPDDPWAVGEAVPPVVAPTPAPRHDPGPGVIGLDR